MLTFVFGPWVLGSLPELGWTAYLVAATFVVMLFASVFLHEVAHALMARARGQEVHELAITLWGGHTAYSGGVGRPLDGVLVAVVGPLTNIVLAVLAGLGFLSRVGQGVDVSTLLLFAVMASNAFVGLFNLLPGLPLDGGQILEAAVWRITGSRGKGTVVAGWSGRLIAVGVVVAAFLWPWVTSTEIKVSDVLFSVLVAGFLWFGASSAIDAGRRREAIGALRAGTLAVRAVTVPLGATVAEALAARDAVQTTGARGHGPVANGPVATGAWTDGLPAGNDPAAGAPAAGSPADGRGSGGARTSGVPAGYELATGASADGAGSEGAETGGVRAGSETATRAPDGGSTGAGTPFGGQGPYVVVVGADGVPLGLLHGDAVSEVPVEARDSTRVDAVAVPFVPRSAVADDVAGQDLLRHLAASSGGARLVPVVGGDGQVTGVLDLATVARAVRGT